MRAHKLRSGAGKFLAEDADAADATDARSRLAQAGWQKMKPPRGGGWTPGVKGAKVPAAVCMAHAKQTTNWSCAMRTVPKPPRARCAFVCACCEVAPAARRTRRAEQACRACAQAPAAGARPAAADPPEALRRHARGRTDPTHLRSPNLTPPTPQRSCSLRCQVRAHPLQVKT